MADYFKVPEEKRSVTAHALSDNSQLKAIDDFTYKCYLHFNAAPAVIKMIMDNDEFDLVAANEQLVKAKITKASTP